MGPREPERYFLRFIFFKPSSKNSKREKKVNNNQKLESSSPFTLLPECNLRRCTKNVKNEQIRKECFHPSGARRTLQEAIFKMFGIDHVALDPQSNRSCPTLGCKTAHGSTLGRKALLSVSASAAEAATPEASLLPVCAISGLHGFVSSSHTSG